MARAVPIAFGLTPTFGVVCLLAAAVGLVVGGLTLLLSSEARASRLPVLLGSALAGPAFMLGIAALVALLFSDSS